MYVFRVPSRQLVEKECREIRNEEKEYAVEAGEKERVKSRCGTKRRQQTKW